MPIKQPNINKGRNFKNPPYQTANQSTDNCHPVFSFQYLQKGSGYSIEDCDNKQWKALLETLYKLSQLTWKDIKQSGRHQLGFEHLPQDRIHQKPHGVPLTLDVRYMVFRYFGKQPIVGFRKDSTYYLLWIDKDFTLYDHG